ncbi:ArnT family glycosyltransferase [Deefgea rivuli]|uniref:ArnT family glycosyltransferase n=1 Tax=Deefgea rivuli TaxID=400948 RepID=UPI00048014FD|nr:glycosyltransferase family 39 protein [Deefgea rivuli]
MLTYQATQDRPVNVTKSQDKPWLLLLLCFFWLIPGLVGHDPWKPDENVSMAIVAYFMHHSDWTLASIAGVPQFNQAPLYFWLAALLANALSWFGVAAHDAARLSTGLWMALGLWGTGLAARELFGRRYGRLAVVILLGCLGLPLWGHHVSPAVVVLCGFAWLAYALALAIKRPLRAGVILACVFLVLLTGASWADALLAVLISSLMLMFTQWRKLSYAITLLTAVLIAFPIAALWGYSLQTSSSDLFQTWWRYYAWGPFGGARSFAIGHNFGFLPSVLVWFAWPALPLAGWALYVFRRELSQPRWQLLITLLLAQIVFVTLVSKTNETLVLPLLVTLSLLASGGVDELRRGAAAALNWFSLLTLGLAVLVVWFFWLALVLGYPLEVVAYLRRFSPAEMSVFSYGTAFAVLVTLLWGQVLCRKRPIGRRALTSWVSGLTLLIGLLVGLFQTWVDAGKSYRPVAEGLAEAMQSRRHECIDLSLVAKDPAAAIVYFTDLELDARPDNQCALYLQRSKEPPSQSDSLLWSGSRLGEKDEFFGLYRR